MKEEKTFILIRMETFSDGVLAVIITIMALELKVPEIVGTFHPVMLINLVPKLASYAIAFGFVGVSWIHHLLALRDVRRATFKLFWLNFLFLFFTSLMPFTTAFVGEHPALPLAVAMWAGTSGLAAIAIRLLYAEAHKDQPYEHWNGRLNTLSVAVAAACVVTAFLSVYLAWILLLFGFLIVSLPAILSRRIFSRKRDLVVTSEIAKSENAENVKEKGATEQWPEEIKLKEDMGKESRGDLAN